MGMRGRLYGIVTAMLAIALVASACGSGGGGNEPGGLGGSIVVSGSSTVEPISALNAQGRKSRSKQIR